MLKIGNVTRNAGLSNLLEDVETVAPDDQVSLDLRSGRWVMPEKLVQLGFLADKSNVTFPQNFDRLEVVDTVTDEADDKRAALDVRSGTDEVLDDQVLLNPPLLLFADKEVVMRLQLQDVARVEPGLVGEDAAELLLDVVLPQELLNDEIEIV